MNERHYVGTPTLHAALGSGPLDFGTKGLLVCLLVCPILLLGRKRVRSAGLLMMVAGLVLLSGCATKPAASTPPSNSDPGLGTTHGPGITYAVPGIYSVDITGTSGNLSVTHRYFIYVADTYDVGVTP